MKRLYSQARNQWMGALALFIVLVGGTAWAATELTKNEVKSKHIKNGGVKEQDLAAGAVTSPKVANGSLLGEDFAPNQLPQGPQGDPGQNGAPGTALVFARVNADGTIDTANSFNVPAGDTSVGGGIYCFTNLPFTPRNVQVTIDSGNAVGGSELATAWASLSPVGCPGPGIQAAVNITKNGSFAAEPFFILFN